MYRADLHCHSTCSDGMLSPVELLKIAKKKGLSGISITDHDTVNAYADEVYEKAKELKIDLLPGVEISSRYKNYPIHILGYAYKKSQYFLNFCAQYQKKRIERNSEILKKLRKEGIDISDDDLYEFGAKVSIGRPHIAQVLLKKGVIKNIQEAFNIFLGEGKKCFSPGNFLSPVDVIAEIHKASGKAFLAHPHLIKNAQILKKVLEMNFDGIECYYGLAPYSVEKQWLKFAKKMNWLVSGGSDFHGNLNSQIELGCSWVRKENVVQIFGDL